MSVFKSWKWQFRKRAPSSDGGSSLMKMKRLPFMGVVCIVMLIIVYRTTTYQYLQTEMDNRREFFNKKKESSIASMRLIGLPRGIIQSRSDLELKPLWSSSSRLKDHFSSNHNLLAMSVGLKQKANVDTIVKKFLSENFTIMLFHYDGHTDGWSDLDWSSNVVHIVAKNQTKWWFAKRFLQPSVVSIYDYIFLWDEDLGVEHFHPGRYLEIMKSESLEISQPALDPNSLGIHHRITIRQKANRIHKRIYDIRGSVKCSNVSMGPPCTGFVEGMAPVFSKAAWYCVWHLIQNDLVHGWGMDMKFGYCAQGDRTEKVGIIDAEYIVHKGIQTLGGSSSKIGSLKEETKPGSHKAPAKRGKASAVDSRLEVRRQSTYELQIFRKRWEDAVTEDNNWFDPFMRSRKRWEFS